MSKVKPAPASAPTGIDDKTLRSRAMWRSYVCPGAGLALIGRNGAGLLAYLTAIGAVVVIGLLVVFPAPVLFWASLVLFVLATLFWTVEQILVKTLAIDRRAAPGLLKRRYGLCSLIGWAGSIATVVLFLLFIRIVRMGGEEMAPALHQGDWLVYERSVDPERLRPGGVCCFRMSSRSLWGTAGGLTIARILAVGGDRISIRDDRYFVNDQEGPIAADSGPIRVVEIPRPPQSWTVPPDSYFVVQDRPDLGADSQGFSWVERKDIVSTKLYYLSNSRGWLTEVK
jgi:signal peptidase I